jgi:hypothetical protein
MLHTLQSRCPSGISLLCAILVAIAEPELKAEPPLLREAKVENCVALNTSREAKVENGVALNIS